MTGKKFGVIVGGYCIALAALCATVALTADPMPPELAKMRAGVQDSALQYVRDCMDEAEGSDLEPDEWLDVCTDPETMRDQLYIQTHNGQQRPR
jgi:hypothetical protein